jgi:hypothetical protein
MVAVIWLVVLVALAGMVWWLLRPTDPNAPRTSFAPGPGATGAIYDLLNEDKRKAIEIIVEQKAEARDAEDADGNLPDLERPKT